MLCKTCKGQKFHSKTQNTFFTFLYNFKVNVSHRNCKQQIKFESSLFDMQYVYQAGELLQKIVSVLSCVLESLKCLSKLNVK